MGPKHVVLLEEERQVLASPLSPGRRQDDDQRRFALEFLQFVIVDKSRSALDILKSLPRPPPPSGPEASSSAHRDSSDRDLDRRRDDDENTSEKET